MPVNHTTAVVCFHLCVQCTHGFQKHTTVRLAVVYQRTSLVGAVLLCLLPSAMHFVVFFFGEIIQSVATKQISSRGLLALR